MTGVADLAADVARLEAEVADLRAALLHARAVAAQERQARAVAEERVQHAWRATMLAWSPPRRLPTIHTGKQG